MCPLAKSAPSAGSPQTVHIFPFKAKYNQFHRDKEIRVNSRLCIHSNKLGMGVGWGLWESQRLCKEAGNGMGYPQRDGRQVGEGRRQGE